jgi:small subunit ribosomal protein S4
MSKTSIPKMKKVRAYGEEFATAGDRALLSKFAKLHRKLPPGMHGRKRSFAKITGYGQQLREKQKARIFYHLTESQLRKYYVAGKKSQDSTDTLFLVALESRLDNVLYRAGFTDSHRAARQLASHAHFAINGQKVDVPSITLKVGDKITFRGKSKQLAETIKEMAKNNTPVGWLKVDAGTLTIEVLNVPKKEEIETPFNEKLIIEFYSR